jgi:glycosyltransferase involved in cell wall biosynthesis
MKIALVHYAYAPVIGGVERVMEEHARLFASHGHEVTVFCQRGESDDARVKVERVADAEILRAALAAQDVVFVHNVMTMPFDSALAETLARIADGLPRVRFVAWVHDIAAVNPDYFASPEMAPPALRSASPRWEYVAVSELRAAQWRALTGAECRVVPNGIEPARVLGLPPDVARLAERFALLDGRLILLHPARLLRRKNIELSLGIVAALKARTPVALLVTGAEDPHNPASRDYAAWLRGESARLGVAGEVIFVAGHFCVGDAELAALYRLADALLFPSRSEGFGLPVLEAALHRLPVFCSDIEPLRSIAPAGSVFIPDDAAAAGAIIHGHLARDPATLAKQRAAAHFGWPAIYAGHLAPLLRGG